MLIDLIPFYHFIYQKVIVERIAIYVEIYFQTKCCMASTYAWYSGGNLGPDRSS
jgi:hypothetical protein